MKWISVLIYIHHSSWNIGMHKARAIMGLTRLPLKTRPQQERAVLPVLSKQGAVITKAIL
jgi:hypothetical protein